MRRMTVSQEETSTPWFLNRKFVAPLFAAVATIIVLFAESVLVDFNVPNTLMADLLTAVWFVIVPFIVGGDIVYDNLRVLLNLIIQLIDLRADVPTDPGAQSTVYATHDVADAIARQMDDTTDQAFSAAKG